MKKLSIILCGAVIWSTSCSNDPETFSSISGTVSNGGVGEEIYLEQLLPNEIIALDTAKITEDGSFKFSYTIQEIGFYRIKQSEKKFITLIADPEDTILVSATWEIGINNYTISGSEETEHLKVLNANVATLYRKRDSLNQIFQGNQNNQELIIHLQNEFALYGQTHTDFVRNFIEQKPGSLACLAAAEQLNPDEDADYYKMIDKALGESYPNSIYYTEFHKVVERLNTLSVGSVAPDILLPDKNGKMTALSTLRGKVVLIDFWASWCKPCRMENPNVVKAYQQFKSKGFEIFGVSLDREQSDWLQAIEDDKLHWTQVSDLQFWNSAVVKLYDIKGIPFALLLDKEGKIIAKNLRGQELTDKLSEILN